MPKNGIPVLLGKSIKQLHLAETCKEEIVPKATYDGGSDSEEYDTDLEDDFQTEKDFDKTQEEFYLGTCRKLCIPPVSKFLRELTTTAVEVPHYGFHDSGAIAVAATLARNITVTKLNLRDNGITHDGTHAVAQMLKDNCFISELDLSENRPGTKGMKILGEMLDENVALRELRLENCGLQGGVISDLVKSPRIELTTLILKDNEIGDDGAIILSSFISCNRAVKVLDVSWNAIHLRGVTAIAKALKFNRTLQDLNISRNSLCNEGAVEMGDALSSNRSLKILDVTNCGFHEDGIEAIADALATNTILHTLKIGRNVFCIRGAYSLLTQIKKNDLSALKMLDMDDIALNQICLQEIKLLSQKHPGFECSWGRAISGEQCNTKATITKVTVSKAPFVVQNFMSFVNSRGWRLLDLFRTICKTDVSAIRKSVDKETFFSGLQKLGVPLRKVQLEELFEIMDVNQDGVVKFHEFMALAKKKRT